MTKKDMFNKKYNQKAYVEDLLQNPFKFDSHKTYLSDLRLIGLYLRDVKKIKPTRRMMFLEAFCRENCEAYNEVGWIDTIQRAMNYSKKADQKLKKIKFPEVYDFEFNYIQSLDLSENEKRILFCSLVFYKFEKNRCNYKKDNYYIPNFVLKPWNLKKYSGIKLSKTDDVAYIHKTLDEKGLLGYSAKGGGQLIANFISNIDYSQESKDSVTIVNPDNSSLYYDYFLNKKKIGFCTICGDIFKKTTNNQVYCKECRKLSEDTVRTVVCVDCGKKFCVPSMNKRTCRCLDCQHKQDNINKREWDKRNGY